MKKIVAIAGGIGSGKSVVSDLLRVMGFPVYDCDSRAKALMDSDGKIKGMLFSAFGEQVVTGSDIDRHRLASLVFGNKKNLDRLNSIVHPLVIGDFKQWVQLQKTSLVFFETAILKESGMESLADCIWTVDAPAELRIERVMKRNNMDYDAVKKRMDSQSPLDNLSKPVSRICNDGNSPLLPQISKLLK